MAQRHNLQDYEAAREAFSWDDIYEEADWDAPERLNVGHEVVDRHAAGGDAVALSHVDGDGEHEAVAEAAVVPKPHPERGNIVKAYVVVSEGVDPSEEPKEDIKNRVKTELSAHEYPREIEFRDELPKTVTGKIRRTELRDEVGE